MHRDLLDERALSPSFDFFGARSLAPHTGNGTNMELWLHLLMCLAPALAPRSQQIVWLILRG